MRPGGLLNRKDEWTQLGRPKPMWNVTAQDASFRQAAILAATCEPFARNDQDELLAIFCGAPNEIGQRAVRLRLGESVQVDDVVHLDLS
jgi:hypothetical protein